MPTRYRVLLTAAAVAIIALGVIFKPQAPEKSAPVAVPQNETARLQRLAFTTTLRDMRVHFARIAEDAAATVVRVDPLRTNGIAWGAGRVVVLRGGRRHRRLLSQQHRRRGARRDRDADADDPPDVVGVERRLRSHDRDPDGRRHRAAGAVGHDARVEEVGELQVLHVREQRRPLRLGHVRRERRPGGQPGYGAVTQQVVGVGDDVGRQVAQIALACGYCDQSAFTRQFKAAVGLTPAQYRERDLAP